MPAVDVGEPRFCLRYQAKRLGGLSAALFGSAELVRSEPKIEVCAGLGLPESNLIQRLVSGIPPRRHRVGGCMRDQGEPADAGRGGQAAMLGAWSLLFRGSSSRPAKVANTSPIVAHMISWVATDSSLNS